MAYSTEEGNYATGRELMQIAITFMQAAFNCEDPDSAVFFFVFGDDEITNRFGLSISPTGEDQSAAVEVDLSEGGAQPETVGTA